MQILPVLDVAGNRVVRAIAGRRNEYAPVVSQLTSSSEPLRVAEAFTSRYHLSELYLADLDAIGGASPAGNLYANLNASGFRLWVDAGVRDVERAAQVGRAGVSRIVVGLETVEGPGVLAVVVAEFGDRVAFSLDLKNGQALGNVGAWPHHNPKEIAKHAIALGVRRLIVLDLARVGLEQGPGTEVLAAELAESFPTVGIYVGGGVRDISDLRRLRDRGMRGALVASALHDGAISEDQIAAL